MFERFTEPARQVVVLAQEEARTLRHDYIGTEHVLLGLLREQEGVAARALESLGLEVDDTRAKIAGIIGPGEEVTSGQVPFTPRAKKVLELALREALSLGHDYIGTEHILLGLVRENDGVAAGILSDAGAGADKVREEVITLISAADYRPDPKPTQASSALKAPGALPSMTQLSSLHTEAPGGGGAQAAAVRRFDKAACRALELALAEALFRGAPRLTCEDLLAGLAVAEGTLAQRILGEHGLDPAGLRAALKDEREP